MPPQTQLQPASSFVYQPVIPGFESLLVTVQAPLFEIRIKKENIMNTLYTAGYTGVKPEDLRRKAAELNATIVDIRYRAGSRNPAWNKSAMQKFYGANYWHCRELGNVNYKTNGPIQLLNPEPAIEHIGHILESKSVILLCVCSVLFTCHRYEATKMIEQAFDIKAVHLTTRELGNE